MVGKLSRAVVVYFVVLESYQWWQPYKNGEPTGNGVMVFPWHCLWVSSLQLRRKQVNIQ